MPYLFYSMQLAFTLLYSTFAAVWQIHANIYT